MAHLLDDGGRVERSAAAPTIALTPLELDLLDQLSKPHRATARGPKSLDHYLDRIARLGGYLGRASQLGL